MWEVRKTSKHRRTPTCQSNVCGPGHARKWREFKIKDQVSAAMARAVEELSMWPSLMVHKCNAHRVWETQQCWHGKAAGRMAFGCGNLPGAAHTTGQPTPEGRPTGWAPEFARPLRGVWWGWCAGLGAGPVGGRLRLYAPVQGLTNSDSCRLIASWKQAGGGALACQAPIQSLVWHSAHLRHGQR